MNKMLLTQLQEINGEVYCELSPELINSFGWEIGDVLGFETTHGRAIQICNLTKRKVHNQASQQVFTPEDDWSCSPYGELLPIDRAIVGFEEEYEEEIDLYKTYGGD